MPKPFTKEQDAKLAKLLAKYPSVIEKSELTDDTSIKEKNHHLCQITSELNSADLSHCKSIIQVYRHIDYVVRKVDREQVQRQSLFKEKVIEYLERQQSDLDGESSDEETSAEATGNPSNEDLIKEFLKMTNFVLEKEQIIKDMTAQNNQKLQDMVEKLHKVKI